VVGLAGCVGALLRLQHFYPVRDWLVWLYAPIWLASLVWALACLAGGHAIVTRLRRDPLPLREHLVFAFACGVLAFGIGIFLIGLAGGLGLATFFGLPALMLALGGRSLLAFGRRAARHLRQARRVARGGRTSFGSYAVFLFGALGVVALYLNVLTPFNIAYDARWYHLGIAEHYAASHGIRRFAEGWFPGALPHLASLQYTWAFLAPTRELFTRIELAAHLEVVVFLATLASIPILVRWLLRGRRAPLAWVAVFLFPGVLVYDATLNAAADHMLAFWAVPLVLTARRFWRTGSARDATCVAIAAAGAALTKYQAVYILAPVALALLGRALWRIPRSAPRTIIRAVAAGTGTFGLLTSIHWLKNTIWYGDPFYPLLHAWLPSHPWNPDVDLAATMQPADFKPTGSLLHKLGETLASLVTFPFAAHDWPRFHRDWPTFGFLFVLMLPFAFLVRGAGRIVALAGAALAGVGIWYFTYHQDRYLQSLVPWMAAVLAALCVRLWAAGWMGRAALVPLLALQIVWGGDHYAFPTHTMLSERPLALTMNLLSSGFDGQVATRTSVPSDLLDVGKTLPPGARVLLHELHRRLGIAAPGVSDTRGMQGAFSYRRARSPRDVWNSWRELGVTHVTWLPTPLSLEAWADEAVFYDFAAKYLVNVVRPGGVPVGALPVQPPPARPYGAAALLGCGVAHRVQIPEIDLAIWTATPVPDAARIAELTRDVDFVFLEGPCRPRFESVKLDAFKLAFSRDGWEIWVRR
jgi:hypothetical protein